MHPTAFATRRFGLPSIAHPMLWAGPLTWALHSRSR